MSTATKKENPPIAPVIGDYQGKPTLTLKRTETDKFPFSFGMGKARLIVLHFDAIKKFVADNEGKAQS